MHCWQARCTVQRIRVHNEKFSNMFHSYINDDRNVTSVRLMIRIGFVDKTFLRNQQANQLITHYLNLCKENNHSTKEIQQLDNMLQQKMTTSASFLVNFNEITKYFRCGNMNKLLLKALHFATNPKVYSLVLFVVGLLMFLSSRTSKRLNSK